MLTRPLLPLWILAACSGTAGSSPPGQPPPSTATLLDHSAYLIALDSSLAHLGPMEKPVMIYPSPDPFPLTAEDLRRHRLKLALSKSVCPGEAALWFEAPQQQEDGRIRLEIVEASGEHGLAGGYSYLFRCAAQTCRLEYALPSNSDYLIACRSSGSYASPPPLTA